MVPKLQCRWCKHIGSYVKNANGKKGHGVQAIGQHVKVFHKEKIKFVEEEVEAAKALAIASSNCNKRKYDDMKQLSIGESFSRTSNAAAASGRSSVAFTLEGARTKIYEWILKTGQPFSVIDDKDFLDLLHYFQPMFTGLVSRVQARTDIVRVMLPTYESFIVEYLRQEKEAGAKFNIGTDITSNKSVS